MESDRYVHELGEDNDSGANVFEDEYVIPTQYSEAVRLAMEQASHRTRNILIAVGGVASTCVGMIVGTKTVRSWRAHHA